MAEVSTKLKMSGVAPTAVAASAIDSCPRVGDGLVQRAQGEGGYEQDQRVEECDAGGGRGRQAPEHLGWLVVGQVRR